MDMWNKHALTQKVPCVRKGWAGVWDALVAAVTGKPRAYFLEDVTFSVWATGDVKLRIAHAQVETGKVLDV